MDNTFMYLHNSPYRINGFNTFASILLTYEKYT